MTDQVLETGQRRSGVERGGLLEVQRVTKRFGAVTALDTVDLLIPAGAFFSLLGPSGCGKTTLLRIIAGLEYPDTGRILVDGRDITSTPPEKRPFNIVFQRYALFPHLSVFDNVAYGLTTRRRDRLPRAAIQQRVMDMLALIGLSGFEQRLPSQLSGGQAQRVAVARALVRQPELVLLDEPLSALDRNVRHSMREELLRIHRELGTTFVLVTHDQDEALSVSEHVALMSDGHVEQVADPETLYRRPATLFAARFIGAGTFLPGEAFNRRHSMVEVEVAGHRFHALDSGLADDHQVQILLRPEDLAFCDPASGIVNGTVETITYFGAHYEIVVATQEGRFRARSDIAMTVGSPVGLTWPRQAGIAYRQDEDSGGSNRDSR